MYRLFLFLTALPILGQDAAAIMSQVAANVEQAAEVRTKYVYHQRARSSLVALTVTCRAGRNGTIRQRPAQPARKRNWKQMIPYSDPGHKYKDTDIDGDLISSLTDDLVNGKESRDGIPHSLFPLSTKDLPLYTFTMKGEAWIDAAELQPVRIETQLAFQIPWGVRVFLGTNLRQSAFPITYVRVAGNVWFPATYGTEFRFNVL